MDNKMLVSLTALLLEISNRPVLECFEMALKMLKLEVVRKAGQLTPDEVDPDTTLN